MFYRCRKAILFGLVRTIQLPEYNYCFPMNSITSKKSTMAVTTTDATINLSTTTTATATTTSTTTTNNNPILSTAPMTPAEAQSQQLPLSSTATTSSPSLVPKKTFYRRPLPANTCTALSSKRGRILFTSSMEYGGLDAFFPLMEQHLTQSEPAYCGISTLVIALNALAIDPRRTWRGPWRWYEESMLNCCVDLEEVKTTGITVSTFKCLAVCQGLHADAVYADSYNNNTSDNKRSDDNNDDGISFESTLRNAIIEACMEQSSDNTISEINDDNNPGNDDNQTQQLQKVLIASYDRKVLGQTGSGHFSPIAAYDPISDCALIMDTARFKYGSHWVHVPLLAQAMQSIDPDSGRSRGFIMLSNPIVTNNKYDNNNNDDGSLPVSILLQSELKSNTARRKFKLYLTNLQSDITVEDVARFWTKDGTDIDYVWEIGKPKNVPGDDETCLNESIADVRGLIMKLITNDEHTKLSLQENGSYGMTERCAVNNGCQSGICRIIPLRPMEVIYIIYLACLNKAKREEIIFSIKEDDVEASDENSKDRLSRTKHQLSAEAELIRYAIDVSDEIEN